MSNLSPFENLGVDVLTIICEKLVYLPNKERVNPSKPIPDGLFRDNRDDLFSLSLTSRACRDVVLSVLWAKISLVASFDHRLTRKLVDVIVNKAPEIGGLIRTLHLKDPPEGCSSFVEKCDGLFEKLPNLRELVWTSATPIHADILRLLEVIVPSLHIRLVLARALATPGALSGGIAPFFVSSPLIKRFSSTVQWRGSLYTHFQHTVAAGSSWMNNGLDLITAFLQQASDIEQVTLTLSELAGGPSTHGNEKGFNPENLDEHDFPKDYVFHSLSKIICQDQSNRAQRDVKSHVMIQHLTNLTLCEMAAWPGVSKIDLINASPRLPFIQLQGRCPQLKVLKVTLFNTAAKQTLTHGISFIASLQSLQRLSLTLQSDRHLEPSKMFDAVLPSRGKLRKLHIQTITKTGVQAGEDVNVYFSREQTRKIGRWSEIFDLKLEIQLSSILNTEAFNRSLWKDRLIVLDPRMSMLEVSMNNSKLTFVTFLVKIPRMYQDAAEKKVLASEVATHFWKIFVEYAAVMWRVMHKNGGGRLWSFELVYKYETGEYNNDVVVAGWKNGAKDKNEATSYTLDDGREFWVW